MSQTVQPAYEVSPGFHSFTIGDAKVTALFEGYTKRAIEASWVVNAPVEEVKATLALWNWPTDMIPTHFTVMLLERAGRKILIDAGFGDNGPPTGGELIKNMKASGVDPEEIDTVLVSHFHSDHINGLRMKDGALAFPNATISAPQIEWDYWMDDARMNAAPESARGAFMHARRVFAPIAGDVRKFDGTVEVAPGVTAMPTPGHAPGHTSFMIDAGGPRLFVVGDCCNNPLIFARRPEFQLAYDMDQELATETRKKVLAMAAQEKVPLVFYHAPFPAVGTVTREGDGYIWKEASLPG